MTDDQAITRAIKASEVAAARLAGASQSGNRAAFAEALAEWEVAEDERERAYVERGWAPAWPPRTAEGRVVYGVTEEEVKDWFRRRGQ